MTPFFQQISEMIGTTPNSTDKTEQLLAWANRAGQLLYDSYDFPGSVFEQFFCFDATQRVISFPWYVGAIRGVRLNASSRKITMNDMRPRYNTTPWVQPTLKWRELTPSPLVSALTQAGQLRVEINAAETFPFSVIIIGQTPVASEVVETLNFIVGETSKVTTNQFLQEAPFGVRAIKKNQKTSSDVLIYQNSDTSPGATPVAVIANNQTEAVNIRVQILDWNSTQSWILGEDCLEVLYKKRYTPFWTIDDNWIDPRLDQALVYATAHLWAIRQGKGAEEINRYKSMYEEICMDICENINNTQETLITMEDNRLTDAPVRAPLWPNYYYSWYRGY